MLCGCVRVDVSGAIFQEDGRGGACPSLQSIFPITLHSNGGGGGGGALTWRLIDPFFMTH